MEKAAIDFYYSDFSLEEKYARLLEDCRLHGGDGPVTQGESSEKLHISGVNLDWFGVGAIRGLYLAPQATVYRAISRLLSEKDIKATRKRGYSISARRSADIEYLGCEKLRGFKAPRGSKNKVDQLLRVVTRLIEHPERRGAVCVLYNPLTDPQESLNRHLTYSFSVESGELNLYVTLSHANGLCDVPGDILECSVILSLISMFTRIPPGRVYLTINDFYLERSQLKQAEAYALRVSSSDEVSGFYKGGEVCTASLPTYIYDQFELEGETTEEKLHHFLVGAALEQTTVFRLFDFTELYKFREEI